MAGAGDIVSQVGWEQKSFWRNPAAAAFTFGFPLMFLVVFMAINGNDDVPMSGHSVRFAQYFVPSILVFGLISASYTSIAFTLSIRREAGLLKRVRATPLRPSAYLAGILGSNAVVGIILSALVLALGLAVYGLTWPGHLLGFLLTIVVGMCCFASIGVLVSTFVPNEEAAPAIINFLLFPLLFISGTFGPVSTSSGIGRVSQLFPVRHLNDAMGAVFNPYDTSAALSLRHQAVMVAWGVGCLLLAIRRFRWEPRVVAGSGARRRRKAAVADA